MLTVDRLQTERQRTRASGARPGRNFDIEAVMAEMRDQGFDPYRDGLELVFGPSPTLSGDETRLERFVFRVPGSKPAIEIEVELLPGQLPEAEWQPLIASGWVRDRINPPIPEFYPAGDA